MRVDGVFAVGGEPGGRVQCFCFDGWRYVEKGYEIAW